MGARTLLALAAVLIAPPAFAADQERGDPQHGRTYAEAVCAECHDVRGGHFDSPNPDAPPFQEIADTPDMTEMALYAFFRTPHASMPNLVVPSETIADLTAYLLGLRRGR